MTSNCPFYGHALFVHMVVPVRFLLLDTKGNQCAVITDRHAPCLMEVGGEKPDWRHCPLVKELRMEGQ